MKSQILVILTLAFIIGGCSKENELKKSVYIYDSEMPELPAYSEWGYNTFGAFYDRLVFRSSDVYVPSKVYSSDTAMQLILGGEMWNGEYGSINSQMSLTFTLKGFTPSTYQDLVALNDSVIDLTDPMCMVELTRALIPETVRILSGTLYFKRVQNLSVDKQHIEAILSGYFEFKALVNDEPVTISDGRFDLGIGSDNFYFIE
jgi:hypothetical protein